MSDLEEHYGETRWRGLECLQCKLCPFATVDGKEVMEEHLLTWHFPVARKRALVQAYDAWGRPIDLDLVGGREAVVETTAETKEEEPTDVDDSRGKLRKAALRHGLMKE